MADDRSAPALGGFLAAASMVHFVRPQTFDDIVPGWTPGSARQVVHVSGVAELATAALVAVPSTRRLGGYVAAALFVAVFPANVKMALDGGMPGAEGFAGSRTFAYARLPLQIPLVLWGIRVGRKR